MSLFSKIPPKSTKQVTEQVSEQVTEQEAAQSLAQATDGSEPIQLGLPPKGEGTKRTLLEGVFQDIPERGLSQDTCQIFNYAVGTYQGRWCHISNYYSADLQIVAQHIRQEGSKGRWIGRKSDVPLRLFGSHLGSEGRLILTEGQIDAMSVWQAMAHQLSITSKREPITVCSITDGVGGGIKSIEANMAYVLGFREVVVFFDQDEPGREAAVKACKLIGPKAKIVTRFSHKDANEALVLQKERDIYQAVESAQPYRPDEVVTADSLLEDLLHPPNREGLELPFDKLQSLTRGVRPGELWTIGAGTGCGKSTLVRWIVTKFVQAGVKTALIPLEQTAQNSLELILNNVAGQRIDQWSQEQRNAGRSQIEGSLAALRHNLILVNRFGGQEFSDFLATCQHLVQAEGVKVIFLDHFSMLADGINLGTDQRRAIDQCVKSLKVMAVDLDVAFVMVSHLSRPEGRSHEEGTKPQLSHFRGSHSIPQASDFVIGLQRDSSTSNAPTSIWLLKNRVFGTTGFAGQVAWDLDGCRYVELSGVPGEFDAL